jgi:homoserine/homoserine lactone efflux protein
MSWSVWFAFFWIETLLSLAPGPAVLFVVGTGLRHGVATSLAAAGGILLGNTIYFALSGLGLGVVLQQAAWFVFAVSRGGVAYVAWLAWRAWVTAGAPGSAASGAAAGGAAAPSAPPRLSVVRAGLVLQLANPKALLFFLAILPGFVDADAGWPVGVQVAVLGVTSVLGEFFVLWGYGAAAGAAAARLKDARLLRRVDRAAALLLGGVAVWMAVRALTP